MIGRRRLLASLPALLGLGRPRSRPLPFARETMTWDFGTCRCGLPVAFLPGQAVNRCGHCGETVYH